MIRIFCLLLFMPIYYNGFGQCELTEDEYKDYFDKNINHIDPIEGIWSVDLKINLMDKDDGIIRKVYAPQQLIFYIKKDVDYSSCELVSEFNSTNYSIFKKTSTQGIYLYEKEIDTSPISYSKATAVLSETGLLSFSYYMREEKLKQYLYEKGLTYFGQRWQNTFNCIKVYPLNSQLQKPSSGTGFAISPKGYVVTNFHVVKDAKIISIRGINGDFIKTYLAHVVILDMKNDLAILKVDDPNFETLGNIPYKIKLSTSDVATEIYTLGFPMKSAMGDEIKYTSGEISSLSGYEGDITLYQHTAPIQPGSSGGPMLDKNGYVIGIINAKLTSAENASYAIKSKYLISLIEESPEKINLPELNLLSGKPISQQVSICKKFVYIIEAE